MVVVGFGKLGKEVARMGLAFGMKVTALRRSLRSDQTVMDGSITTRSANHLLAEVQDARAVMVCCPGTRETVGLVDAKVLGNMSKTCIIVNVGRGPVVDQEALYRALETQSIFAAGIDTWYSYPPDYKSRSSWPPAEWPFQNLDNVVMSPHRGGAGGTEEVEQLRISGIADGLNALSRGEPWPHMFNLMKGY